MAFQMQNSGSRDKRWGWEVIHKNGLLAVSVVRHLSPEISGGGAITAAVVAASVRPSDIIMVVPQPNPPP